jgi:hypothetical protein
VTRERAETTRIEKAFSFNTYWDRSGYVRVFRQQWLRQHDQDRALAVALTERATSL